jgi:enamine deaminase RidA (YjgF/YER057c/UK114 family)
MDIHAQLKSLGLTLPLAPEPAGVYVPAVTASDLVVISGQLPLVEGQLICTGPVPSACSLEQAQEGARQCVLNGLAVLDAQLSGDWDRFVRMVRLGGFVCSDNDFTGQSKVINGGSDLLGSVLGDAGRHARAAVGVNALPLGASVEIELMALIKT